MRNSKIFKQIENQVISQQVEAIDLYSASVEDLDTVFCFFFLIIKFFFLISKKSNYPKKYIISG